MSNEQPDQFTHNVYIVPIGREIHGSVGFHDLRRIPDNTSITLSSNDTNVVRVPSGPHIGLSLPPDGCQRRAFRATTVGAGKADIRAQFIMEDNRIHYLTIATIYVVPVSEGIDLEFYTAIPESFYEDRG